MRGAASPGPLVERCLLLSLRRPRLVIALWAVAVLTASFGLVRLRVDTTTGSFIDREDAAWFRYVESTAEFGADEFVTVALTGKAPYEASALAAVQQMSSDLQKAPGVRRVDSLATVPLIRSDDSGDLVLTPALTGPPPTSPVGVGRLAELVNRDRIAPGNLASSDGRTLAVNIQFEEGTGISWSAALAALRERIPASGVNVSGVPVFRAAVSDWTRAEILLFVPLTLVMLSVLLRILLGSVQCVGVALAVAGAGACVTLGAMAAAGVSLSIATMLLPSILLALGCTYTMHMMTAAREGQSLGSSLLLVAQPVLISGVTTAMGFLALASVNIAVVRHLGAFGSLGALVLTLGALSLAPALLAVSGGSGSESAAQRLLRGRVADWLASIVLRRRTVVVFAWGVALVASCFGLSRIHVSTDIIRWFPVGSDVRDDYERIRSTLVGITPINVVIRSTGGESVVDPSVLAVIDALVNSLRSRQGVGSVVSVVDPLALVNRALVGSDKLPGSRETLEQYLLLLEGVEQLEDVLASDRLATNVLLRLDDNSSKRIVALAAWAETWLRAELPEGYVASATGIMYEIARSEEEIAHGQIRGLLLAAVAIGLVVLLLFRDYRTALIAFVPNAVPLALAFGLIGILAVPLDAATVCLGAMALGIAVDDTIHVIFGFEEARLSGSSASGALTAALARVLPALVFTTLAVGLSFSVIGLSDFTLVRNLGLLTSGTVFLALAADLTLLPALLSFRQTKGGNALK